VQPSVTAEPAGLLAGLKVIEVSSFVAAPLGGMTLAQLGAEVVRVDPVGGGPDIRRWPLTLDGTSLYWAGLNKGKKSVTVDFRSTQDQEKLRALIGEAGIVLTNAVGRDWLSYESLAAMRPDLIHVQVEGKHDGSPAVDYTVNAATGFPLITGPEGLENPVNHVLPAWDMACGLYAAVAVLSADRRRAVTGEGAQVRIALEDVALAMAGNLGFLAEAQISNVARRRIGNHLYGGFARDFLTADGRRIMIVALTLRHWRSLLAVTGLTEVVGALEKALGADFDREESRFEHRKTLAGLLEHWFEGRTLDEATTVLEQGSFLWSVYRSFVDLVAEGAAELAENPLIAEVDQPGVGPHLVPGSPIMTGPRGTPGSVVRAPALGEHSQEVLGALAHHGPPLGATGKPDGPDLTCGVPASTRASPVRSP